MDWIAGAEVKAKVSPRRDRLREKVSGVVVVECLAVLSVCRIMRCLFTLFLVQYTENDVVKADGTIKKQNITTCASTHVFTLHERIT